MIKFSATLLATLIAASVNAATVDLRIMETTDLHSNMMDFDYYKDTATEKFGLVRTASLINDARNEVKNSVLVDNGDLIQGSPLADYMSAKGLKAGDIHPVYKAPRFYVSTSKSIIKALINMHSFEIQLSPIG